MSPPNYKFVLRLKSAALTKAVMALWSDRKDTYEIAHILGLPESTIARALHAGRELRRGALSNGLRGDE